MSTTKKTTSKKKAPAKKAAVKKKAPAKKAAVKKKAPAKKAPTKKAPAKKKATAKKAPAKAKTALSPEERYQRVQFEAYLMAEKNQFAGDPSSYWIAAEKIINKMFS